VGASEDAAASAGIRPKRQIIVAMAVSGDLAGLVGMNEIANAIGKLLLDFGGGACFTGIGREPAGPRRGAGAGHSGPAVSAHCYLACGLHRPQHGSARARRAVSQRALIHQAR
jgi:hypothetical protein